MYRYLLPVLIVLACGPELISSTAFTSSISGPLSPGEVEPAVFEGHYDVGSGRLDVTLQVENHGSAFVLTCNSAGVISGAAIESYPNFDAAVLGGCTTHEIRFNMPQYTWGAWINYDSGPRKTFPLCRAGTWPPPCPDR